MTAIELKRIVKDGAIILLILAALLLAILSGDQDAFLTPAMEMFLLLYASFFGWSMFERERQENATEYMLSLPISRSRLLLQKFLPRFACVTALLLVYLLLHQRLRLPSFLAPADFAVLFAGFFLLSIAFSVSLKNFLSAFFLTCLLLVGQVLLIMELDNGRGLSQAILQASLTAMAVPLLFFALFQRYDIRPASHFNRRFFPGLLALAALIAGGIWAQRPTYWNNYYLTRQGKLIRNSCLSSELLPRTPGRRIGSCLVVLRESDDGGSVYGLTMRHRKEAPCQPLGIVRLDLHTGELKKLYDMPSGWTITGGHAGEIGSIQEGKFLLLLRHPGLRQAMVVALAGDGAETFPIRGEFSDPEVNYARIISTAPLRLVVLGKDKAYVLHGDGRIEEIAAARTANAWQDRLLLFNSSGVSLYQIGERPTLLWRSEGRMRKILRRVSGFESRFALYRSEKGSFLLDMTQAQPVAMPLPAVPFTYQQNGDDLFVVFAAGARYRIGRWRDGRFTFDAWEPGFTPAGIRVSPYGMLVFDRQKFMVHPFKTR